jgi:hypothetical protein
VIEFFRRLLPEREGLPVQGEAAGAALDAPALPPLLYVKSGDASIHARQDRFSETVAKPGSGEKLHLLAQASGSGEIWYMVRTDKGVVGWIRFADVEARSEAGR